MSPRRGNLFPDWRSNPASFFGALLLGLCSCAIVGTVLTVLLVAIGRVS